VKKYNQQFLIHRYLRLGTHRQDQLMDFCADGSNNTESHKDVPIGGLGDIDINLQGKIPQKNNVGVNRRFQAKNTQY